jgi:peroxiredoxin
LGQLREIEPELSRLGFQLFGISPDKPGKLRESSEKHKLGFALLSDSQMMAAKAFGVAYSVDETTLQQLREYNIDLEEASGEKHHLLPVPAVFLVATDGLILFEYVHPDYKVRIHPDLLLTAARVSGT